MTRSQYILHLLVYRRYTPESLLRNHVVTHTQYVGITKSLRIIRLPYKPRYVSVSYLATDDICDWPSRGYPADSYVIPLDTPYWNGYF